MKYPFRLMYVVVLLAALFTGLPFARPAAAQGNNPGYSITVTGVGTAAGKPDIASVEFGAETINTTLATAYSQAADTLSAITQAMIKMKIALADIQTSKVTVEPQDRVDPRAGITGNYIYRVRSTIRVTLRDLTQVDQVMRAAVEAGANIVDNFTLGIDNIAAIEQQARTAAISNARERASQLAQALGFGVGDAVVVSETITNTGFPPAPAVGSVSRGANVESGNMPVNIGQLIVTVQIQVTFNIKTQR